MISILKDSEIDREQWSKLVESSLYSTFFQTAECYDFYNTLSFLQPFLFGISENGTLKGIACGYHLADGSFMKRFFSSRAIIPGGILLSDDISVDGLGRFLNNIKNTLSVSNIYVEIRNFRDYSKFKDTFSSNGFAYHPHLNFQLQISDTESLKKKLNPNKRRYIKVSLREGAQWHVTQDEKEIYDFYEILKKLYDSKVKTPLYPIEFFIQLSKLENGKLVVIRFQDKIIGGGAFVVLPGQTIYEWFVCGSDREFKNINPSILATWSGIEMAEQNEIKMFDFMGAGQPDIEYGVRKFKSEFGGELVEHGRFLYIAKPLLYKIGKKAVEYIKKSKK